MILNSRLTCNPDYELPATCFNFAKNYAKKLQRPEEAEILISLSTYTEQYMIFLSRYFTFVNQNPEVALEDEDFMGLRRYLNPKNEGDRPNLALPQIKAKKVTVTKTNLVLN
jgi:hypothetical protein